MRQVLTIIAAAAVVTAISTGCGRADKGSKPATPPTVPSTRASTPSSPSASPSSATPRPVFSASIARIPSAATLKYSWHAGCPVPVSKLRTISMTYWGMDHQTHQGQLVVNASVADDVVKVFHKLYDNRYPIRRMVPVDAYKGSDFDSIEADNTSAFNCRNATGSSSWSQHAYGLAIDLNTCENPYVSADGSIAHPRCRKYGDRSRRDPRLIHAGDATVRAFASIGWGWGGSWSGAKDYQHFSSNGR
jgi:hypothetical protein